MKYIRRGILTAAAAAVALLAGTMSAQAADATYVAHLQPLNTSVTQSATKGEARFTEKGGELAIDVTVEGAPASTEHWQHFHGFKDGSDATCPTLAEDANGDGIVDLIETGKTSGTTMVPLIADPVSMDVPHGKYPSADAKGAYHYQETVALDKLQAAFATAFPGQKLDLDKRVVFIHGVPGSTKLADSVASLGPIPAQVTIPIACGVIERVH